MEKLLHSIKQVAEENGMEAFIVGGLLKICPKGIRTHVLLEIDSGPTLYKHRNSELTSKFKGRRVTEEWIVGFIKNNKEVAEKVTSAQAERDEKKVPKKQRPIPLFVRPIPLSDKEVRKRREERHTVSCSCRGEVEDCIHCYGKGYYVTDGFGKKV